MFSRFVAALDELPFSPFRHFLAPPSRPVTPLFHMVVHATVQCRSANRDAPLPGGEPQNLRCEARFDLASETAKDAKREAQMVSCWPGWLLGSGAAWTRIEREGGIPADHVPERLHIEVLGITDIELVSVGSVVAPPLTVSEAGTSPFWVAQ